MLSDACDQEKVSTVLLPSSLFKVVAFRFILSTMSLFLCRTPLLLPFIRHQNPLAMRSRPLSLDHIIVSFLFLFSFEAIAAVLTYTGQTLLLDDIPYYLPPLPYTAVNVLPSLSSEARFMPVTVIGASATSASHSMIESIIDGFSTDDVWNEGFLEGG